MASKKAAAAKVKSSKTGGLEKVATLARPHRLGHVVGTTLYLLETKVSDDYLPAFPDATVARIVAYDVTDPASPVRQGACDVKAAWWFVASADAVYVLVARKVSETSSVMDLAVLDVTKREAPRLATTLENVGAFGSDSKLPVLALSGTHLFVNTRASAELEVFDVSSPLAPKKAATVTLKDTPQAGFGDARGVLITFLGNDVPMVEVSGTGTKWNVREVEGLGGSEQPARVGETIFRATGDYQNSLGLFDGQGKQRTATKLGPTSIVVRTDGERVVTLGDALSVWTADGELVAKKKTEANATFLTVGGGLVLVPQRPDAKAADKKKAFAFDLWRAP
ncbi:MAG: hypothetical protein U0228_34925 [Myxococcaceae bacterium]